EVVNAVVQKQRERLFAWAREQGLRLRVRPLRPCRTATRPLPGGDLTDALRTPDKTPPLLRKERAVMAEVLRDALKAEVRLHASGLGLDAAQADHLVFLYGTRYTEILNLIEGEPEMGERIAEPYPDVRAEIVHAVQQEFAQTAADFLMRRAMLAFTPDQ